MKSYRIEIAVETININWSEVQAIRDRLEKKLLNDKGVREPISSSIRPMKNFG